MAMDPVLLATISSAAGAAILAMRWWSDRNERGRAITRRQYANTWSILPRRTFVVTAPLSGLALIVLGAAWLLPRPALSWVVAAGVLTLVLSMLLAYRVPQPLMARWMRDEIESGHLKPARPDKMDWLYFWILAALGVGGATSFVLLILVVREAG